MYFILFGPPIFPDASSAYVYNADSQVGLMVLGNKLRGILSRLPTQ